MNEDPSLDPARYPQSRATSDDRAPGATEDIELWSPSKT